MAQLKPRLLSGQEFLVALIWRGGRGRRGGAYRSQQGTWCHVTVM